MIINLGESRLVEATQYVYKLNSIKIHNCRSCPKDYEELLKSFKKVINQPENKLLACIEDNQLIGILSLLVVQKEKYLELLGVFAEFNFQEVTKKFYVHLKSKYSGYQFDASFPQENIEGIQFMESIHAKCLGFDIELTLSKDDFVKKCSTDSIVPLSKEYYEQFKILHDENFTNVYWTSKRIINALDKFDIFLILKNRAVIGSIVISKSGGKKEVIYFIETTKEYRRLGYAKKLLTKALEHLFQKGTTKVMLLVERENEPALNLYKSLGFIECDSSITYSLPKI